MTLIKKYFGMEEIILQMHDIVLFTNDEVGIFTGDEFISPYKDYVDRGWFFRFCIYRREPCV